jgi:hypothetical protein
MAAYTFTSISLYIKKRYICDVLKHNCIYIYIDPYHDIWHCVATVVVSRLRVGVPRHG